MPSGRTLTTGSATNAGSVNSGNNIVTLAGSGTWSVGGTGDNNSLGIVVSSGTAQLNKVSNSGVHAVGGPGLTVNSGGTAQITGTGGDQLYDSADDTINGILDLNGNSEAINGLNGSGTVTTTLANGTPTLTVGAGNDSGTFTGTIEAGVAGSIALTQAGTGTQAVACITQGSGTSGPYINVNAGTLILNGTADNAFTEATVNSGGTLLLDKTSTSGVHAIGGGLTINSGGLAQITGTGGDQIYNGTGVAVSGGTFDLNGNAETVSSLAFSGGTLQNSSTVNGTLTDSGTLTMNGNVTVNFPEAPSGSNVVLQYSSGERSGTGSFVAGNLPAGDTVVDNTSTMTVSVVSGGSNTNGYGVTSQFPTNFPAIVVPSLNPYEIVVAVTTPQMYGAKGDGKTDDSAAFQAAMNAVYHSGGNGGGVVYVPPANYAFSNSITVPTGVTLQGDWQDWTKGGNGLVGTTFKVYYGAGNSNATPLINLQISASLKDINIWYPNQNPNSITPYPYSIELGGDNVVQNVVLVNSYLGIQANGVTEWILSTVIGTPLALGLWADNIADICQTEDIRFSPAVWADSGLTNAPVAGGSYATWMKANGTGMQIFRLDGLANISTVINGYNLGLDFEQSVNGASGCAFYNGWVTNCNIAVNANVEQNASGLEFSDCTLAGGTAIKNPGTNDSTIHCSHCTIIGTNSTAVFGNGTDWQSVMAFQDCSISNAMQMAGPGVFNLVNCNLSGSTQCVMSATATRAAFTGCTFSPSQKIVNNGNSGNLIMDPRQSSSNAMPVVNWTNVMNRYVACGPATTNLYVATSYGATGNGTTDDTAAIQSALTAAGNNGGGIVYLPPGNYHTTNTLSVPGGVELRGAYELRHSTWGGGDGLEKGSIINPYGGQGTTNGPPAVALAANSGLVGMTFNYPNQTYNIAFPPTIQGRGANVYIIGAQCAEPWIYVDLDTYTCTNHFLYFVDGWALNTWIHAGNGSSGTIADTHGNPTYWLDNPSGQNQINWDLATDFGSTNMQTYVLGDCTELFVKDFIDCQEIFMHCGSENGQGPNVTAISAMCDGSYQSYIFDATGPCTLTNVNSIWWCAYGQSAFPNWTDACAIISTTNFTGTVRFLNVPLWGGSPSDYQINGGDIGLELAQLPQAAGGVQVNGGVFHLINASILNGASSPFTITYGTQSGIAGKTNEYIGSYAYSGCSVLINNPTNAYAIWNDYALNAYNTLDIGPVIVGDFFPNGQYQFQAAPALTFQAGSVNGINASGITVQLTATNLAGASYATNYTSANGLTIGGTTTARTVSVPLATNAIYKAVIEVTDASGNSATNILSFDTISPAYAFEAEDFDYSSGKYINNPQTNGYAELSGTSGIDYTNEALGQGNAVYRPQGLETENAGDIPRLAYSTGLPDYDVGFATTGNWGNYTRSFPAGTYNIYMRSASPNGPTTDSETLYQVTAGQGTKTQTTSLLGTFSCPNTGNWQTYAWVPLLNSTGGLVTFTGGAVKTLRVTTVNGNNNINCYLLVTTNSQVPLIVPIETKPTPVFLHASVQPQTPNTAGSVTLQWAGESSNAPANVYYAPDLTPPVIWTLMTNAPVFSNGQWTVVLPVGTKGAGFYELQ